jgi:hypothetical protein
VSIHVERNGVLLDRTLATPNCWPGDLRGNAWASAALLDALRALTREAGPVLSASQFVNPGSWR